MNNFLNLTLPNLCGRFFRNIRLKIDKRNEHLGILCFLFLSTATWLGAVDSEGRGRGFTPLSEEHFSHIEQNWPKIVDVKHTKIGAARIQNHLRKLGADKVELQLAASHHDEFIRQTGKDATLRNVLGDSSHNFLLPSHVDNSKLPSFPPIGDQRSEGSCVAWASTYYQATHEIGLLNGINNKTSSANILSPKWTYNMLNGGQDRGLIILDAYNLLSKNGAVSIASFPYDGNYLAWDLNTQDWIWAISKRMTAAHLVSGLGGSEPQNLQAIKQLLNNGHVLTIGTYVDSWVFSKVGYETDNSSNEFAGQHVAFWMNGKSGGHCMTIVGYDDNIWTDINQNGVVDPGEKGAFLIANSWGSTWGNNGFIWVAYDAFNAVSSVSEGPSRGRVPLGDALGSYAVSVTPIAANYSPKLIAQFSLMQSIRDQISVSAGVSPTTHTNPATIFNSGALAYHGGAYRFNGTVPTIPELGTFAIDLTDLLSSVNTSSESSRFYLMVTDGPAKHPTTLTSYSLIDNVHNKTTAYGALPIVFDGKQVTPHIDYAIAMSYASERAPLQVAITSPSQDDIVHGLIHLTVNAFEAAAGIKQVEFYIDGVHYATDIAAPFVFSFDASSLLNGTHQLSVIAHNIFEETAEASIRVQVNNDFSITY